MIFDEPPIRSSELTIREHLRKYYSKIFAGEVFSLSTIFNSYQQLQPSLHRFANSNQVDQSVLNYCLPRLPDCIDRVSKVIISSNSNSVNKFDDWSVVASPSRRRKYYFDNYHSLYVFVTSDSDLDDFINTLIAYAIETNKSQHCDFEIESHINRKDYQQSAQDWWTNVVSKSITVGLSELPIYFISSNLHSLTNIIGGYANKHQDDILKYVEEYRPELSDLWGKIRAGGSELRVLDYLYYASSKYYQSSPDIIRDKSQHESDLGIKNINPVGDLVVGTQIIPVSSLINSQYTDPYLKFENLEKLKKSQAVIINIDYPLGYSAYYLFSQVLQSLHNLKGLYIIGKAAILNGQLGDIQIPRVVFDERTNNIYFPKNIFNHYFPFPSINTHTLTDQKATTVYGTFLENSAQLQNYIKTNFNIIEMESGPYLASIDQHLNKSTDFSHSKIVHLDNITFDLGIINYASDNPLTQTLGDKTLSVSGVESTYLSTLSVLQRIIDLESI